MNRITILIVLLLAGSCQPQRELTPDVQPRIEDIRSLVVYNGDTDYFLLDVANYRHDSTTAVTLKSLTSGATDIYKIDQIWAETPARLRVWINQRWPIKPGQYSITLTQSDSRLASAAQLLEVKPGIAQLDGFTRVSPGLAGHEIILSGKNLFRSQQVSLLLRNALGQSQPLSVDETAEDGATLRLTLPNDLKPGYYSLAINNPDLQGIHCQRFSILRTERQPYILGLDAKADPYNSLAQTFCPDTASITFARNESTSYAALHTLTFGTTFFTNVSTFSAQVQLTNVATQQTYRLPLQITDEYYGSWYELKIQTKWFEGRYGVNSSLPTGLYRIALEYTDKTTGQTTISEPYERVIQIN